MHKAQKHEPQIEGIQRERNCYDDQSWFIKTENQNEVEQDISKLDCKKIWYELWKNIATEVISKSGETKEMKIMSRITDEKAIEEFKNLFSSGSLHYRKWFIIYETLRKTILNSVVKSQFD